MEKGVRRCWLLDGLFLVFFHFGFLHFTDGKCFSFLSQDIGGISPGDVPILMEGSSLTLNCVLNDSFAIEHFVTSRDIFWQKSLAQSVLNLSPALESRISVAYPDDRIMTFTLRNVTREDSAPYRCALSDRKSGFNRTICSVDVTVAGPPQKYKNFQCLSENLMNLRCTWERGDTYPIAGATKYSLKFHLIGSHDTRDLDCPYPSAAPGPLNPKSYLCRWESLSKKNELIEPLNKPLQKPMFHYGYVYNMTINGTNDLGSQLWTEIVTVSQHVRPATPTHLTATVADGHACILKWQLEAVDSFKRDSKLLFRVEYRRDGQSDWQVDDGIETESHTLEMLDANTVYHVRVRAYPGDGTGYYSHWTEVICGTKVTIPEDAPGLVPGAYEELGNGAQRQVTLYWKGIPPEHYNGPNFAYKIFIKDSSIGEEYFLTDTQFANHMIPAPFNRSTTVRVLPTNCFGEGKISEEVIIPAVRNQPFVIRFANVVKFNSTLYEVTWATNKPEETLLIDLYWCPTSLSSHLAWCTTTMSHMAVAGKTGAMNITVEDGHEYRFAVSAQGLDGQQSGMLWVGRQCSIHDREPWLDSLQVTPLANASVKVTWNVPCQHRIKAVTGYRVDYYLCQRDRPAECMQNEFDVIRNGSEHVVRGLLSEQSYCFEVSVLEENASASGWKGRAQAKCLFTAPSAPALPIASIVGGSVAGGLLLVVLAFIAWRGVKRIRKGFEAIQDESRRIAIPNSKLDRYSDDSYEKEEAHYTKVDLDEQPYLRQLSDGIGSMESDETIGTMAKESTLPEFGQASFTKVDHSTDDFIESSLHDLTNKHFNGQNGSLVSLNGTDENFAVLNKAKIWARPLAPETKMQISLANRRSSTQISAYHSGLSDDTQPTSEYVTTASFQPNACSSNGQSSGQSSGNSSGNSSGALTGDTGYISQPASLSSSGLMTGDDSGASSGFAELDSPLQRKRNVREPLIWKGYLTAVDSHLPHDHQDDMGDDASPPNSPTTMATTKLLAIVPQGVPLDGYVAWP